jgi:ferric-dicitrate binding protein FerR (iron transport regulator)
MHSKLLPWLSLLALFAAFTAKAAAQQQVVGKITAARVVGAVSMTVKATGAVSPVANLTPIYQGTTVTTGKGASVVLVFANGATVNLGTDSVLDIDQFTLSPFDETKYDAATAKDEPSDSTTSITLTHGELVGKVAHLKADQSKFTVSTPVGSAGIRGTTFRIVYRPDGNGRAFFSMTTLEGNVEVVLKTGTVTPPIAVTDSKEVVLADVTVTVNDQTGQVTVSTGTTTTVVPTTATATTTQQIVAAAQEIAQAVATVVITSPPSSSSSSSSSSNSGSSSSATKTNTDTTSGAGL